MKKLGEKYIAGFLDADGGVGIRMVSLKNGYYPRLYLSFSQEIKKDKILYLIQDSIGGSIREKENGKNSIMSWLDVSSGVAKGFLSRIVKYLVVKRRYVEFLLDILQTTKTPLSKEDAALLLELIKNERHVPETRVRNYPSRQWLAGYFDGDGCIGCSYRKTNGRSYLSARLLCRESEKVGILLIQKSFGGDIYYQHQKGWGDYPVWVLHLEPSRAKKFIGYFVKHSVIKKSQLYFVFGCAKGGNYRNGKPIKDTLSQLKAQEQRLNDSDVDVSTMVSNVNFGISDNRGIHMRKRQSSIVNTI